MSEFFGQIYGFLESDPSPLCTSWLANSLNISTTETVQVLNQFVKHYTTKSDLHISYLLTGYDFSNRLRVAVVSDENVSSYIHTNLRKSLSNTIFSISKGPTDSFQSHVVDSCLQLADTLLHTTSSIEGSFLTNVCGDICLAGLSVKPVGERIFSSQNVQFAKSLDSTVTKILISQTKSSSNSSVGKPAAPVVVLQPSDNQHYETLISSKSKLSKGPPIKYDDDEEWEDGDSPAIGRKRMSPVATSLSPTKCVEQENLPLKEEETTKKTKVMKRNTLVRGGMDDFMDDIAIEQFKFQQQHLESSHKKTKKVLVEKTSVDDKGYFMTEMVWEEVSDNEEMVDVKEYKPSTANDIPSHIQHDDIPKDNKKADKALAQLKSQQGKKTDPKPSGGTQKSMMSFFAKK